jgi:hypothetical protein
VVSKIYIACIYSGLCASFGNPPSVKENRNRFSNGGPISCSKSLGLGFYKTVDASTLSYSSSRASSTCDGSQGHKILYNGHVKKFTILCRTSDNKEDPWPSRPHLPHAQYIEVISELRASFSSDN